MASSDMYLPVPINSLLEEVASKGKALTSGDLSIRKSLLSSVRALCLALETPIESVLRMEWAEVSKKPQHPTGNNTSIALNAFCTPIAHTSCLSPDSCRSQALRKTLRR